MDLFRGTPNTSTVPRGSGKQSPASQAEALGQFASSCGVFKPSPVYAASPWLGSPYYQQVRNPDKKRKRRRWALALFAAAVSLLVVDYFAYPWWSPIPATEANKDTNGLWIRYTHYFGEVPDVEVAKLASRLDDNQFAYAYYHVRFIKKDGTLAYRYPEKARRLLATVREHAPRTKLVAWVFAGNERGNGEVDLTDVSVREKMVEEARWLIEECGFDGIQWDYEMCDDGEQSLLLLLEETRSAIPPGAFLGVCSPVLYPGPVNYGWSDAYISEVSSRCDQIAVMCYDTAFYLPRSYVWLAANQVERFSAAIAKGNKETTFVIGVPTYEEGFRSHGRRAENLQNAIRGVMKGFDSANKPMNFEGIALFADYTTDDSEWRMYDEHWLGR
jgi:hypothetical protein